MNKKILLSIVLSTASIFASADDLASNLMLMNSYTARQNQDLWGRMRAGFKLDHTQSDRVKYFEKMYTKNPKTFSKMMNNARPFLYFMLNETERNGLPSELVLIPGVESTFDPLAKNPTDPYAGMWQFVPTTGKRFNMVQNSDIDQRRDIIKSTQAAFSYLNYLYRMFGQWDVAIGAYNWGEGGMYRAILSSGQPLGHVTYSDLQLRQITMDYVPKIIALASIIEHPEKFGVTLDPSADNTPFFAVINPPQPTTLNDLFNKSGSDLKMFSKLNGQYKDTSYTVQTQDHVLLPVPNQAVYYANIGLTAPTTIVTMQPQLEPSTDTQEQLVANDSTDKLDDLISNLNAESSLVAGSSIAQQTMPASAPVASSSPKLVATDASAPQVTNNAHGEVSSTQDGVITYVVAAGDTLYSIAKRFNADISTIKQQNNIPGNNLTVGQTLTINN